MPMDDLQFIHKLQFHGHHEATAAHKNDWIDWMYNIHVQCTVCIVHHSNQSAALKRRVLHLFNFARMLPYSAMDGDSDVKIICEMKLSRNWKKSIEIQSGDTIASGFENWMFA